MDADITVIGAGVIGLAIASELATPGQTLYVLEKNSQFGQETSSRNSEVIHAGLYYRPDSLKASLCIEGNRRLYELCNAEHIPCRKIGKIIAACNDEESGHLESLLLNAAACGARDLRFLSRPEIGELEPHIAARTALYSESTGIIDSHRLMRHFLIKTEERGGQITCRANVTEVQPLPEGYLVKVAHSCCNIFEFTTRLLINAAGLDAHNIAAMLGHRRTIHYCKGDYFSIGNGKNRMISHLIYPPPEVAGLGIHATLDMGGRMRLGPDVEYIDSYPYYTVSEAKRERFYSAVKGFLPFLEPEDLSPDIAGMRPKLQGPGETFRDFEILLSPPGAVHLLGIESPGLTASPAIARHVASLLGHAGLISGWKK
jgi:L-2-hydroxyglutarate oxidase LhgO